MDDIILIATIVSSCASVRCPSRPGIRTAAEAMPATVSIWYNIDSKNIRSVAIYMPLEINEKNLVSFLAGEKLTVN